jgi:hypothetical protein
MSRKARKANPDVNWWVGSYVVARIDQEGDFCPHNMFWRLARNEHEATMGLEEWDEDEPTCLPLTSGDVKERAAIKDPNERRLYDIRIRMLYRCGCKAFPSPRKCALIESTPFPVGWTPREAKRLEQN